MLTQEQAVEIRVMARRGEPVRSIARQLGCSRNTVRRYLREAEATRYGPRSPRPCKIDAFKKYLLMRVEQARPRWIPATVLMRESTCWTCSWLHLLKSWSLHQTRGGSLSSVDHPQEGGSVDRLAHAVRQIHQPLRRRCGVVLGLAFALVAEQQPKPLRVTL